MLLPTVALVALIVSLSLPRTDFHFSLFQGSIAYRLRRAAGLASTRVAKKPAHRDTLNYFKESQLTNHDSNRNIFALYNVKEIILQRF